MSIYKEDNRYLSTVVRWTALITILTVGDPDLLDALIRWFFGTA